MPVVISYRRFSSKAQEQGDSLRRQVKLAEEWCHKNGHTLDKRSFEDLGLSAYKGKNVRDGALGAFLKAVDEKLIPAGTILLVESLDRVTRTDVMDALEIFTSIVNRGITLVTINDGQQYSRESIQQNWTQLIVSIAQLARANEESATKSKRVKEAWDAKRAAKEPSRNCPPWLQVNEAGTAYVLLSDKVQLVQRVFSMANDDGMGTYLIAKTLTDDGTPYLGRAKSGWDAQNVSALLHNQSVIGRMVSVRNNVTIDDYYPAIIDKAVFYAVQEKIKQRSTVGRGRKGENVANLFSGLLRCGCGSTMRMVRIPTSARVNTYLECMAALYKKGCDAKRVNYEPLEQRLLAYLLLFKNIDVISDAPQAVDPTTVIRAEIEEKKQAIQRLLDIIESSDERQSSFAAARLSQRERELQDLEQRLRSVVIPQPDGDVVAEAVAAFDEHERLLLTPGPELAAARLRLQSVIKQFVEQITLPKEVLLNEDGTPKLITLNAKHRRVKCRNALVLLRPKWRAHLMRRYNPEYFEDATPEEIEQYYSLPKLREPTKVRYPIPAVGGYRGRRAKQAPEGPAEADDLNQ